MLELIGYALCGILALQATHFGFYAKPEDENKPDIRVAWVIAGWLLALVLAGMIASTAAEIRAEQERIELYSRF